MPEKVTAIRERDLPENMTIIPKNRYKLFSDCAWVEDGKEQVGTIWDLWFSFNHWGWFYQVSRKERVLIAEKDLRIITLKEKKAIRAGA